MLLTEAEVAERLRCSKQRVRALRLGGRLLYIPGRPPKVDEADLIAFLEEEKREAAQRALRRQRAAAPPDELELARMRARKSWLQKQMREWESKKTDR